MLFLENEENSKGELVVKDLKVELLGLYTSITTKTLIAILQKNHLIRIGLP